MRSKDFVLLIVGIAMLMALPPADALACPTCFGDVNSAQTEGIKWAILSLLGITGTVLAGIAVFIFYLKKKAVAFNRRFSELLN